jgi:hypothetical protein
MKRNLKSILFTKYFVKNVKIFRPPTINPLVPNLFIHAPTGKSVGSNSNNIEPTDLPVGLQLKELTDLTVGATKKKECLDF